MLNADVPLEPVDCSYKGCFIVCNNVFNGSPSAQDFLKEKRAKGTPCFHIEGMPFGPCGEGAMSLNDVLVAGCMWHEHSVDVCLAKEGDWHGNSWGNLDFHCLADLAL